MAKALSDGGASLQSDSIEGAETEIEDLLVEPAHWFAPGGFEDPHGEICDNTVDGLQEAALRGDLCLLRKYIRAGSTPPVNAPLHVARGDEYLTLLHVIASKPGLPNSAQILVQLIKANANPNARSTLGSTPLMFACFHKNVQIAEVLLENEADPDAVDDHGKTALRYAVSLEMKGIGETEAAKRSAQLADILEAQGSDLDHGGLRSPMAEAVIQDNRDAMTRLLELGASSDGLVYALAEKSELVIKELISGGANPFVKNEDGLSCLDVAHERGSEEIMELLQDYIVETERSRSQHLKMKPFGAEDPHWTTKGLEHCQWLISGCWESRKDEEVDNVVSAQLKEIVIKDMGISPQRGTDGMQLCRYQVQAILENPVVQATLTTNLVLALFLPDFWVILAMQGDGGLDNALVMILVIFVLEFIANVVAHGDRYVNKYPFWTDIVGILSVPWDHSLVADNFVDIFEGSGLARVTKFAKLSARAVRLSRLGKLLRFFPGSGKEGEGANGGRGPAKGISAELMSNLSVKVALLIIVLVLILPVMDFFTWPPDDFSLDTWTTHIHWMAKTYPEDVSQVVEDMRRFYDVYSYFPFQVIYHFTNNTQVIQELQNARAPMRLEDVLVIAKEDTTVKFNFRAPKLTEAILNVFVMIGVIFTMLVAAACVSSAVSHTVLSPMEDLLEIVHSTAIQIFDSVEQMAIYFVKDYSNQQWCQEIGLEAKDDHRSRFSREVELLAKVLEKLDLLTIIANAKRPVDEFEQLGNGPAAFCQDYATYAAVRHRLTLPRPAGQLDLEEMEHDMLMQTIGAELAPAEISRQDWNAWDLNIADLNSAQRQSLARCLIVIYDTSPGFDEYHAVRVTKYKCHCEFIKVVESQYEDDQVVQYHNWIHAVDVAFTLRSIFHRISAERYFATHERFALMVASFAHDLGNSGVTNGFLAQSAHEFALGYNDLSCLQNMSCAKLFRITGEPETSIFLNFNKAMQRDVRQVIIFAILHTDPGLQLELLAEMWGHYQNRKELFDLVQALSRTVEEENEVLVKANKEVEDYFWNADVKYSLRNLLVHVADNSYSLKPWDICSHWANALSEEFFKQGDLERNYKMPMQPLNDRVRANVAHAQIVNIQHIIVPQTKLLVQLLPELRSCKHHMWLNLWRWIVKWKRSRPDHEELHRVLREVKELHDEDVPEEEIRALEHQEVDEEGEERRDNKQKIKRRMSVRSAISKHGGRPRDLKMAMMCEMLRGLRNTLSKSGTSGFAAGSGAQGATVINKDSEAGAASSQPATNEGSAAAADTAASAALAANATGKAAAVSNADADAAAAAALAANATGTTTAVSNADANAAAAAALAANATGKEIVPAEAPSAEEALEFEEHWSYIESLGLAKLPGEEHIVRFLADSITASPLPAPWAAHRDEEGKVFYGNPTTGETSWEHPLEDVIRELAGMCRVCVSLSRSMRERSIADLREAWEVQAKEEFSQWYSAKDQSSGKEYYCNSLTKETMWEHPAEVLLPGHFLKLKSADRLLDEAYLQDLANLGSTLNNGTGKSWNLMKRTLESNGSTVSTEAGYKDAHKAIKEELANKTLELESAKEYADKVKAEFEALKQRFEASQKNMSEAAERRKQLEADLLAEQQKLQSVISEAEAWKKQAMSKDSAGAEALQEKVQLQVELELERQKAEDALKECETLKQQVEDLGKLSSSNQAANSELEVQLELERKRAQEVAAASAEEAAKRKVLEEELEQERQFAKEAASECTELKAQAQSTSVKMTEVENQCKTAEERLELERHKVEQAISEVEAWKKQAMSNDSAGAEAMQERVQLQVDLEAERQKAQEALKACEALKQQVADLGKMSSSNQAANSELEVQLEVERQRAQKVEAESAEEATKRKLLQEELEQERQRAKEAASECTELKAQARFNSLKLAEVESQCKTAEDRLELERSKVEQARAECDSLKTQALLQEELLNAKASETKAPKETGESAQPVTASKELQEEMTRLTTAANRAQEAEKSLHAKLEAIQEELVKEKARAEAEASKCVAARDVQEAIMQEMISANVEKRTVRESLEAQLQEQKKRASEFEAKYLQLQAEEESRNRGQKQVLDQERSFVDRLIRDKEGLEQSTGRLQEQLAKANMAANELEAKFNQERLKLEAANQDRLELMQRQKLSAEEAEHADKVLQHQIKSAQEAELRLSNRAAALKALMEGERAKVEQLTEGFAMLAKQVGSGQPQPQLENQLQELNSQMLEMRAMLKSKGDEGPKDAELTHALNEVSVANAQIQTAVAREKDALERSGPPEVRDRQRQEGSSKPKKGKAPRVRELHGKLYASTDDTIQTGQKVRHTLIESALVRQQTQLCKQMIQEVESCRLAQSVKLLKSKAALKALNGSLRDEVEKTRQELQSLEEAKETMQFEKLWGR